MNNKIRENALYSSYLSSDDEKKRMYDYEINKASRVDESANYNLLTGLPVLRMFNILCTDIIRSNPDKKFGVIMSDITQFKAVNEFLGRQTGDMVLHKIADCLNAHVQQRPLTVAGHARADIFVLFTAYEDRSELSDIATGIKNEINALPLAYHVNISFGICASEESQPSISYIRDCANLALHEIKGKHYADCLFFEDSMRTDMLKEKLIESELLIAIENEQIVPYIQPQVDMSTNRIIGGEALTRWIHPSQGLIAPDEFISIAEDSGLIISVDYFIWQKVFEYQRKVIDSGRQPVPISVNVSRMHVYDPDMTRVLTQFVKTYDVAPEYVPLELTESAFTSDENKIILTMENLRSLGFTISMDDFGSGYSSLNMLKSRDMDEIKIDKGMLSDLDNKKGRIIMSSMLDMLSHLDVNVIAEGVETPQQQDFLVSNGCTNAQGFLFYKPMPLAEFDKLI